MSSNELWILRFVAVEYTPGSYRQQDLDAFAERFDPRLVGVSPEMDSVDGGMLSVLTHPVRGRSNFARRIEYQGIIQYHWRVQPRSPVCNEPRNPGTKRYPVPSW